MNSYTAIGVMSGSSCDGLDLALCTFNFNNSEWNYELLACKTVPFPENLKRQLQNCRELSGHDLRKLDLEFGNFIAVSIKKFMQNRSNKIDLIASHGHTVFHDPGKQLNLQIGDGSAIANICHTDVVFDFRTMDIRKGGQGAPLVPAGDKLLFPHFQGCLNLGGIANVTIQTQNSFTAFDICAFNQLLNKVAERQGVTFDDKGNIGKHGNINDSVLRNLNNWPYYQKAPSSIGNEEIESSLFPILKSEIAPKDLLRSLYEHFADKISSQINNFLNVSDKLLVTGGGAFNNFFIELLEQQIQATVVIPEKEIVSFKEAIIFAFLGVLRIRNETNCFSTITGSTDDSICGTLVKGSI